MGVAPDVATPSCSSAELSRLRMLEMVGRLSPAAELAAIVLVRASMEEGVSPREAATAGGRREGERDRQ